MTDDEWKIFHDKYYTKKADIKLFMDSVYGFFEGHPSVEVDSQSVIHSLKKRMKDSSHLREKIDRKNFESLKITPENIFDTVTDLAGVRILLLFQSDLSVIDKSIRERVSGGDWVLHEKPKAFTWDPETTKFFNKFDLEVITRETSYTSVHYILKPRSDSPICCELQVRTLFEEIWGEIDHKINYPIQTNNVSCKEQLMVLSKIVGAGSRLVDSIQKSIKGHFI